MKRITLLLALLLCLCVAPHAQAASSEVQQAAESLNQLGLFLGTGTKDGKPVYDLDKVPTRNQAVIMLVRLLGKEQEAVSGKWNIPFKDVKAGSVTAPYIGYAYANGLTKGTTATTYSGTNPVTRNQYLLFLMRAMGYDDPLLYNAYGANDELVKEGMNTSEAANVAEGLDLLAGTSPDRFTRGDVALISNRALDTCMYHMKPNLETLREALGLGTSPAIKDKPVKLNEPVKNESLDSFRSGVQSQYSSVPQELAVSDGMVIHYQAGGTPHGTIDYLSHVCQDGTQYSLYLPWLNNWGVKAQPENLTYHADHHTVTYDAVIPENLPWFSPLVQQLRKAGTYRFTYRLNDHTCTVSEVEPESSVSPYVSVDDCLKRVTGIYRDGKAVTVTSADCVYSEIMRQDQVASHAEWFPNGNVPPVPVGQEAHMVWLIAADVTGSLGGLPSGSLENPRVTIVSNALTGELLSEVYEARK